jgi:hypothetical protein
MNIEAIQKTIEEQVHKIVTKTSYNSIDNKPDILPNLEGYRSYGLSVGTYQGRKKRKPRYDKRKENYEFLEWSRSEEPQEPTILDDTETYSLYGRILAQGE